MRYVYLNQYSSLTATSDAKNSAFIEMTNYEDETVSFKVKFAGSEVFLRDPDYTLRPITFGDAKMNFQRIFVRPRWSGYVLKWENRQNYWKIHEDGNENYRVTLTPPIRIPQQHYLC